MFGNFIYYERSDISMFGNCADAEVLCGGKKTAADRGTAAVKKALLFCCD